MTRPQRVLLAAALLGVVSVSTRSAWAQFEEMVKHIPRQANVAVLVNAEKLFASEIAQDREAGRNSVVSGSSRE